MGSFSGRIVLSTWSELTAAVLDLLSLVAQAEASNRIKTDSLRGAFIFRIVFGALK